MDANEMGDVLRAVGAREYQMGFWLLKGFAFQKASRRGYVMVEGRLPLAIAKELYENEKDRAEIRSGGDCACRPPEKWADYFDDEGREILTRKAWDDLEGYVKRGSLPWHVLHNRVAGEQKEAEAYVTTYHIDTVRGLRRFVDAILRERPPQRYRCTTCGHEGVGRKGAPGGISSVFELRNGTAFCRTERREGHGYCDGTGEPFTPTCSSRREKGSGLPCQLADGHLGQHRHESSDGKAVATWGRP